MVAGKDVDSVRSKLLEAGALKALHDLLARCCVPSGDDNGASGNGATFADYRDPFLVRTSALLNCFLLMEQRSGRIAGRCLRCRLYKHACTQVLRFSGLP